MNNDNIKNNGHKTVYSLLDPITQYDSLFGTDTTEFVVKIIKILRRTYIRRQRPTYKDETERGN